MADKKISALSPASTPLAGTEVLPIVQGGSTVKVAVSSLGSGSGPVNINQNSGTVPTPAADTSVAVVKADATQNVVESWSFGSANRFTGYRASGTNAAKTALTTASTAALFGGGGYGATTWSNGAMGYFSVRAGENWTDTAQGTRLGFAATANGSTTVTIVGLWDTTALTLSLGNLIPAVAGNGINFTANTPAAGMTSQLLNWYEEGTWTPSQGAGLTVVGAFTSSGTYTRIGRQVTAIGILNGATSIASAGNSIVCSGLPFSATVYGTGALASSASSSGAVIAVGTDVYGTAVSASTVLRFSLTYFV